VQTRIFAFVAQDQWLSPVVDDAVRQPKKGIETIMNRKIASRIVLCVEVLLSALYGAVAAALLFRFIKVVDWSQVLSLFIPVVWNDTATIAVIAGVLAGVARLLLSNRARKARPSIREQRRTMQFLENLEQKHSTEATSLSDDGRFVVPQQGHNDGPATTTCQTRLSAGTVTVRGPRIR
jgi:hypothetical protein